MFACYKTNLILNCMPKGSVRKVMQKPYKPDDGSPFRHKCREFARRECLLGSPCSTDAQIPVASTQVIDDGKNEVVDLLKHSYDVVNASVRCVDENTISQSQLSEPVQPLHRGGVQDFKLSA
ncbi:MAG TPA: hypothetical protein VK763_01035 [Terriglobales bacterium]|nr:hypothetical protein [Terriglobales bacterium]